MRKLPLSPRKLLSLVGEVHSQASEASRLLIAGKDRDAIDLVHSELIREADPAAAGYLVETALIAEGNGHVLSSRLEEAAAAVLVVSSAELQTEELKQRLIETAGTNVPIVLVLTEAPGVEISFPAAGVGPKRVVAITADGSPPADILAAAVVDAAGDAAVALSAGLPALRDATCNHLIRRTARQNGIIGVLFIIPGADFPVMTLNQARMILRMAAAHGESIGVDRALELLSVVGGALSLRALARQVLCVMPGPGWAIKGSFGYTGTVAMGRAAKAYFDGTVRVTPSRLAALANKVKKLRG